MTDDNLQLTIKKNEIHLWICFDKNIHDPELLERYRQLLTIEEAEKQNRFHFEQHRHQYLVARAMLKIVLSRYAPVEPILWEFERNRYGKPEICYPVTEKKIRFNLSHTEGLIVLGITLINDIGVDAEYLKRKGKLLEIAESHFSNREVTSLNTLPESKQLNRFFDLWTLKESFIKACGKGLSIPLKCFGFDLSGQQKINVHIDPDLSEKPAEWAFWLLNPSKTHRTAIALKKPASAGKTKLITREIIPMNSIRKMNIQISDF